MAFCGVGANFGIFTLPPVTASTPQRDRARRDMTTLAANPLDELYGILVCLPVTASMPYRLRARQAMHTFIADTSVTGTSLYIRPTQGQHPGGDPPGSSLYPDKGKSPWCKNIVAKHTGTGNCLKPIQG